MIGQLTLLTGLQRGEIKEISKIDFTRLFKIAMKKKGLDLSGRLSLQIPEKIHFQVDMDLISSRILKLQLQEEIRKRCQSCDYEISHIDVSKIQKQEVQRWQMNLKGQKLRGRVSLPVQTWKEDRRRVFWVPVEIKFYRQVPVLEREVSFNEPLREGDFSYKKKDITHYKYGVPHISQLVGAKLKRRMSAQSIVWLKDLVKEKAIQVGQMVDVKVGNSLMKVELRALAKQSGYIGDVIQLENIKTRKILSGRIVQKGRVEVQ